MLYKDFSVDIKSVDENEAVIEAVFSTADIDRHGEKVSQEGWQLKDFKKNPVILWGHDHSKPAIGKATKIGFDEKGNLAGKIQFAVKENPFANTVYQLFANGFMKAFSVGYICEEIDFDKKDTPIHKINTLLEISAVNVPANALALAKQKGIDIAPLEHQENDLNSDLKGENSETNTNTPETENIPQNSENNTDFNENDTQNDIKEEETEEVVDNTSENIEQEPMEQETKEVLESIKDAISTLNNFLRENERADSQEIKRSKLLIKDGKAVKKLNRVIRVLIKTKNQCKKERRLKIKL